MSPDASLAIGRLLRTAGPPEQVDTGPGIRIHDERLEAVLSRDTPLLALYRGTLHGEGPIWDPTGGRLLWSDVPNRRLLAWHDDGHVTVAIDGTAFMNGNALERDGRFVHCEHGRRCISRSDGAGEPVPIVTHFEGRRLNSPNDITVAADGAIWFTDPTFGILMPNQGSVAAPELDHRSLYRFDPSSSSLRRMADFEQPNGVFFSPDGQTLYVSDTSLSLGEIPRAGHGRLHQIEAFDVGPDSELGGRRVFLRTDHGYPDGFAVDARGWVWTSAGDGIHVHAADGCRLGFIPTPETPANCAFGGAGMGRLFIAATSLLLALDLDNPARTS